MLFRYNLLASLFLVNIGLYCIAKGGNLPMQFIGIGFCGLAGLNVIIYHYRQTFPPKLKIHNK